MSAENDTVHGEARGAPGWWKSDGPDKTWVAFVERDEECSRLGRALSIAEFQRDWLTKSLAKIGISLVPPHPEHPQDVEMSDKGVDVLVCRLEKLMSAPYQEFTEQERNTIVDALNACGVDDAFGRLVDTVNNQTMTRAREILKSAVYRVCLDDPGPKST